MPNQKPIINQEQVEAALSSEAVASFLATQDQAPIVIVVNHGQRAYPVREVKEITLYNETTKRDHKAVVFKI